MTELDEIVIYTTLYSVAIFLGVTFIVGLVVMLIDKIRPPKLRSKYAMRVVPGENWKSGAWSKGE